MILCKRLVDDTVIPHIVMGNFKETIFHQRELVAGKHYFYIRCFQKGGGCFIEVYDYSGHSIARYELDILLYTLTWMKQTGLYMVIMEPYLRMVF